MFDIGWSELVVIGVVALIAIGPKELPGVLRMVGQWVGRARRMAAEFQGQFNEAMREAELADLKKTFDDAANAAQNMSPTSLVTSAVKDMEEAVKADPSSATVEETAVKAVTQATPIETTPAEAISTEAPATVAEPAQAPDAKAS